MAFQCRCSRIIAIFSVSGVLMGGFMPAVAADDQNGDTVTEALRVCAALEDAESRLACFEALAAASSQDTERVSAPAAEAPDEPVENKPAAAANRQDGAADPDGRDQEFVVIRKTEIDALRSAADDAKKQPKPKKEETASYESVVVNSTVDHRGRITVVLKNGQRWRQIDGLEPQRPRKGEKAVFKKGFLSSWFGQFGNRRAKIKMRLISDS